MERPSNGNLSAGDDRDRLFSNSTHGSYCLKRMLTCLIECNCRLRDFAQHFAADVVTSSFAIADHALAGADDADSQTT